MSDVTAKGFGAAVARALRAVGRRVGLVDGVPADAGDYAVWMSRYDVLPDEEIASIRSTGGRSGAGTAFTLHLRIDDITPPLLPLTLIALRDQLYSRWTLAVESSTALQDDARALLLSVFGADQRVHLNDPTVLLGADMFHGWLRAGDALAPHALSEMSYELDAHPEVDAIYSDEDAIGAGGERQAPQFKPDFNPDLLLSTPYVGQLLLVRGAALEPADRAAVDTVALGALVLRLAGRLAPRAWRHIPRVLYHASTTRDRNDLLEPAPYEELVRRHLARFEPSARVEPAPEWQGGARVRHPVPDPAPLVTIIIPTRNQAALLKTAIDSVRTRTTYPRFEILVVDNGSDDAEACAYIRELAGMPAVRIHRDARPFNWAALNNAAAGLAQGSILCFLNDDIEVLTPDWLEEMVGHATRPDIGAVGARLWYPDGTLQHGGLVLVPDAGALHVNKRLPRGATGYLGRGVLTQNVSVVTGACLVVRREVFAAVSGFDEGFAVDFNDVDFCLRLSARGYRHVWTPYAELIHREAASRGPYEVSANRQRFARALEQLRGRWGGRLDRDPAFNVNLAVTSVLPPLAWPPRQRVPGS